MSVQITIIGLGQIGTSIGLALADHRNSLFRMGHDREPDIARSALNLGALDKISINLPSSVREADIVLLSLPIDQLRLTFSHIAQDLREDAVVLDTAPIKRAVAEWARELLPAGCHYVGMTPMINPEYLNEIEAGSEAAHADLFQKGLMAIVPLEGTPAAAIKLAVDLSQLIGATPLFTDAVEVDGLMAATHLLPQLTAAAILDATVSQPGWREGVKFAGKPYSHATRSVTLPDSPEALGNAAILNTDNVVRVIDNLVNALQTIRTHVQAQDEQALVAYLDHVREARERWWEKRVVADWIGREDTTREFPTAGEFIKGLLAGRRPKSKGDRSRR